MLDIAARASRHLADTLAIAMDHSTRASLIVADGRSELSRVLTTAYAGCLPAARVIAFDDTAVDDVKAAFDAIGEHDLVVLVQSTVFRIPDLRIRVELFRRGVKVIEHSNLERMEGQEIAHYVDALAYDPAYYRGIGHALKAKMDAARTARIESLGETLFFDAPLEIAKVNIGDFSGLKNVGSQFPIGEVFTESRDLEAVHGRVAIYGFTDTTFRLNVPETPAVLIVERGRVVGAERSSEELDRVLQTITEGEGEVWIRELGFGMNRAFSREKRVTDVGAFERVCGVHLSLGARHGVYKKPHLNHRENRFHVDSFVVTDRVLLDDEVVYADGAWCPSPAPAPAP